MDVKNKSVLIEITFKILRQPEVTSSNEFMAAYDIIYNFCTEPTTKYEIKGAPIYDLLVDIAKEHTTKLEAFNSIDSFNANFAKFQKSISILCNVYEYLERYYIKTSIIKRNDYVKNIKDLFYFYYYVNYLDSLKTILENMILLEIVEVKSGSDLNLLKNTIASYRNILLCCDQEDRYTFLKESYLKSLKKEIDYQKSIKDVLSSVYKELSIVFEIFDNASYHQISKKIVLGLAGRSEEIIKYILKKIKSKKSFFHAYKILAILGPCYLDEFIGELNIYTKEVLKNCNEFDKVFNLFIDLTLYLERDLGKNKNIKKIIRNNFVSKIKECSISKNRKNFDAFMDSMVAKIDSVTYSMDKSVVNLIFMFFGLFQKKGYIVEKLAFNMQRRLILNEREISSEKFVVESLAQFTNHEEIFRLKVCLNDVIFSKNFVTTYYETVDKAGLRFYDSDFVIEPKFLTYGFWNLSRSDLKLFEPLEACKTSLSEILKEKNKRSFVEFNHTFSCMVLELNSFEITLDTNMASILLTIQKYDKIDIDTLREVEKTTKLNEIIDVLIENNLVIVRNKELRVNCFYQKGNLNLFNPEYCINHKGLGRLSSHNLRLSRIMVIEAALMRFMKENKSCIKMVLINKALEMEFLEDEVIDAIESLKKNSYLIGENDWISYVP